MNGLLDWRFTIRYALRSLQREGIRTLLAGLSIALGVASLVAMQTLAGTLYTTIFVEQLRYGGDAALYPPEGRATFSQNELAQIARWQRQGLIRRYSPLARGDVRYLRTPTSGRITFLTEAWGIDPTLYPLVGDFVLRTPAGAQAVTLLRQPTDVLVTRDLAANLSLQVGDPILVGGGDGAPVQLTVVGIVQATPNQQGNALFYSLPTARLLTQRRDVVAMVSIQWGDMPAARQAISKSALTLQIARTPAEIQETSNVGALFDLMLKGAGVLGLLVGGLGVANTLQVILARRTLEIAILKSVGYRQPHLLWLIGVEVGLLGLGSSGLGTGAGILLGNKLVELLGSEGALLAASRPPLTVVLGGLLAGSATALIFGLRAVLALSEIRPLAVLRALPDQASAPNRLARFGLFAALFLLFGLLVGWIVGTLWHGLLYVAAGLLLLLGLRLCFQMLLWLLLQAPLPPWPMLRLARVNLRQRSAQAGLILLALWAGVFTITLAALIINTAQHRLAERQLANDGYNLRVDTVADQLPQVTTAIMGHEPIKRYTRYQTTGSLDGETVAIEGRAGAELAVDLHITGKWDESVTPVLLPASASTSYQLGDPVTLTGSAAVVTHSITARVVGFYTSVEQHNHVLHAPPQGIIVTPQTALALGGATLRVSVLASFPVEHLDTVTMAIGEALPAALVFSKADFTKQFMAVHQALFAFVVATAGLAGAAGAVLIANAAGLAVVERQREIGIFKAVGYSSGHLLRLLVGEYALLGLVAGLLGVAGVLCVIRVVTWLQPAADLRFEPQLGGLMILFSTLIAIGSALVVAWRPSRVPPLVVLRQA